MLVPVHTVGEFYPDERVRQTAGRQNKKTPRSIRSGSRRRSSLTSSTQAVLAILTRGLGPPLGGAL